MKRMEKLAAEYVLSEIDPSDYVELAPDMLAQKIFLAGFRKACELIVAKFPNAAHLPEVSEAIEKTST